MSLRKEIFGLGSAITADDEDIVGGRLPTNKQVLRCFMYLLEKGRTENITKMQNAQMVLDKIRPFYQKGNIPMIQDLSCCKKIVNLHDTNAKLREIPAKRRAMPYVMDRVENAKKKLEETFTLWKPDAESIMTNKEDILFLQSMKTDRSASFGSFDTKFDAQMKRKYEREQASKRRKLKSDTEVSTMLECVPSELIDDPQATQTQGAETDRDYSQPSVEKRKHRTLKTGTHAFVPADIMKSPKLVALSTRMSITPSQSSTLCEAFIEEIGGDASTVHTSYAYTDKVRRQVNKSLAEQFQNTWVPPAYASLHWDSKLMTTLTNKNIKEERLTIAVGDACDMKILGVPSYQAGSGKPAGEIISQLSFDLMTKWGCTDNIVNMVFDTTSANTGHISAACISIQAVLGRPLLWSGCRHHIGELVVAHVFNDLKIEVSKSPEITMFQRLQKNWDRLPHSEADVKLDGLSAIDFPEGTHAIVTTLKEGALATSNISQESSRDDYLEFANLTKKFLEIDTPIVFMRPGALHKARWLAKLLYMIKICLFETVISELPAGVITSRHQPAKVRKFVNFATLVYSQWWMKCMCPTDAPWNDLCFYKNILSYKQIDGSVSASAQKAFDRHLWYLTAELVPLALFGENVPADEKQQLAQSLMSPDNNPTDDNPTARFGSGFGKPAFPKNITTESKLSDFITPDSWYFFKLMNINSSFLSLDVGLWLSDDSYKDAAKNVRAINVVNDCAERGVKLSSDFISGARCEENYQDIIQVVEGNRKDLPNLRKRKMQ